MVKQCLLLSKDFHGGKKEPWVIGLGWVPISIFKNTFLLICLNFEKVQTGCLVGNPVRLQLIAFTQSQNFLLDFFSHGTNNNIETIFPTWQVLIKILLGWGSQRVLDQRNEIEPNFSEQQLLWFSTYVNQCSTRGQQPLNVLTQLKWWAPLQRN